MQSRVDTLSQHFQSRNLKGYFAAATSALGQCKGNELHDLIALLITQLFELHSDSHSSIYRTETETVAINTSPEVAQLLNHVFTLCKSYSTLPMPFPAILNALATPGQRSPALVGLFYRLANERITAESKYQMLPLLVRTLSRVPEHSGVEETILQTCVAGIKGHVALERLLKSEDTGGFDVLDNREKEAPSIPQEMTLFDLHAMFAEEWAEGTDPSFIVFLVSIMHLTTTATSLLTSAEGHKRVTNVLAAEELRDGAADLKKRILRWIECHLATELCGCAAGHYMLKHVFLPCLLAGSGDYYTFVREKSCSLIQTYQRWLLHPDVGDWVYGYLERLYPYLIQESPEQDRACRTIESIITTILIAVPDLTIGRYTSHAQQALFISLTDSSHQRLLLRAGADLLTRMGCARDPTMTGLSTAIIYRVCERTKAMFTDPASVWCVNMNRTHDEELARQHLRSALLKFCSAYLFPDLRDSTSNSTQTMGAVIETLTFSFAREGSLFGRGLVADQLTAVLREAEPIGPGCSEFRSSVVRLCSELYELRPAGLDLSDGHRFSNPIENMFSTVARLQRGAEL